MAPRARTENSKLKINTSNELYGWGAMNCFVEAKVLKILENGVATGLRYGGPSACVVCSVAMQKIKVVVRAILQARCGDGCASLWRDEVAVTNMSERCMAY